MSAETATGIVGALAGIVGKAFIDALIAQRKKRSEDEGAVAVERLRIERQREQEISDSEKQLREEWRQDYNACKERERKLEAERVDLVHKNNNLQHVVDAQVSVILQLREEVDRLSGRHNAPDPNDKGT